MRIMRAAINWHSRYGSWSAEALIYCKLGQTQERRIKRIPILAHFQLRLHLQILNVQPGAAPTFCILLGMWSGAFVSAFYDATIF